MLENRKDFARGFASNYIRNLVKYSLPGASINYEREPHTFIGKASQEEFKKHFDRAGGNDPGTLALSYISTNKKLGTIKYVVLLNSDGIGNNPGQEPELNTSYAILHELVEMEVIQPPEEVTYIAEIVSQNRILEGIAEEMEDREIKKHLEAIAAEFIAALNIIDGSPAEKREESLRLLNTGNKAARERRGHDTLENQIRTAVAKEVFRIKGLSPITHHTY